MKNLFKVSALVLGLGLGFSQVASAAVTPVAVNSSAVTIGVDGGSFANSIAPSTTFNDYFAFKLDSTYDFTGVISATFTKAANSFSSFSANLYNFTTSTSVGTFNQDLNGKFVMRTLEATSLNASDTYRINVSGVTSSANTALSTYTGSISVSPVPEAEEWAMMMLGLGMMGVVARRKKALTA